MSSGFGRGTGGVGSSLPPGFDPNDYVLKAGDIMTGHLTLNADPVDLLHAATKQYVDAIVFTDAPIDTLMYGRQDAAWARSVAVSGDTMTGGLIFNTGGGTGANADTGPWITLYGTSPTGMGFGIGSGRLNYTVGNDARLHCFLGPGGTSGDWVTIGVGGLQVYSGDVTLLRDPTAAMHAVTKQYVDAVAFVDAPVDTLMYGRKDAAWARSVAVAGDTMTGGLSFGAAVASGFDDLTRHIAVFAPSFGFNVTSGQINYIAGTLPAHLHNFRVGGLDITQISGAGIRMIGGDVELFRNPTAVMHAVNKQYVDDLVTGTLVFIGTIDASTGNCDYTVVSAIPDGPLIDPTTALNQYVIADVAGTIPAGIPAAGTVMAVGDWLVSDGAAWILLAVGGGDYVLKSGDTMSGGLLFGSTAVTDPNDTSRHLTLWGTPGPAGFGFNVTSNRLNYSCPATAAHSFYNGDNAEMFRIDSANVIFMKDGGGYFLGVSGGGLLKAAGTAPLKIRCTPGNGQPLIESNTGTDQRDILDEYNGMYAAHLSTALDLNLVVPATYARGFYGLANDQAYTNLPPGLATAGTAGNRFLQVFTHSHLNSSDAFQVLWDIANAAPKLWSRHKVDGVATWSAWAEVGGGAGIADAPSDTLTYGRKDAAWSRTVALAGDTMTGGLKFGSTVSTAPTDTTRHITLYGTGAAGTSFGFSVTGGTLNYAVSAAANYHDFYHGTTKSVRFVNTGIQMQANTDILLARAPTADLHAATKAYVDAQAGGGGITEAPVDTFVYGRKDAAWARSVALAGDIMTGFLTLNANPTSGLHAATKQWCDATFATIGGLNARVAYYNTDQTKNHDNGSEIVPPAYVPGIFGHSRNHFFNDDPAGGTDDRIMIMASPFPGNPDGCVQILFDYRQSDNRLLISGRVKPYAEGWRPWSQQVSMSQAEIDALYARIAALEARLQ